MQLTMSYAHNPNHNGAVTCCRKAIVELDVAARTVVADADLCDRLDNARLLTRQIIRELEHPFQKPSCERLDRHDPEPARLHDAAYPHA
ncbi:MAG: hypothetical protein AAF842_10650 [Planctomycetota bacterium]